MITKDSFRAALTPSLTGQAMVLLFREQEADEQAARDTLHDNKRGFASWAAKSGTYFAKWILDGRVLTGRHLERAKTIAAYHWKQCIKLGLPIEAQSETSSEGYRYGGKFPTGQRADETFSAWPFPYRAPDMIKVADAKSLAYEIAQRDPFVSATTFPIEMMRYQGRA